MAETLQEYIEHARLHTRGTMPVGVLVKDETEQAVARAYLKGKKWANCIEIVIDPERAPEHR